MDDKKFLIIIAVASLLLIGGGAYFVSNTSKTSSIKKIDGVKAVVDYTAYNWGKIGINNGNVEKVFKIKNKGKKNLKLFNVKTSCMCTTAQLSLGDEKSPIYGMHNKSSYVLDVLPGQTANLKVVFDPAYHGPQAIGPITREIVVETNDPKNSELTFVVKALVTK